MCGRSTISRHSDSLRGERHWAWTVVLQAVCSPDSVQTRGRSLSSISGRDGSPAASTVCTDSSRTYARAALQHFEIEARKRSNYLAVGHERTVDDGMIERLVVHERAERPAL